MDHDHQIREMFAALFLILYSYSEGTLPGKVYLWLAIYSFITAIVTASADAVAERQKEGREP